MFIMYVLLGLIVLGLLAGAGIYNGLVGLRNAAANAWAGIEVQLKRRHDLIPNLVETARGYMQHERETLEAVTAARTAAAGARGPADASRAEGVLGQALGRLMLVAESYPDLKANANFLALQEELGRTGNALAGARQGYNEQVKVYNNKIEMFPSNVVAGMFGFREREFFEAAPAEREAPQVKF